MTDDMLTAIDRAHLAAEAAPEDEALRWRVYEALAGAELFVLLAGEPGGDAITPQVFDLDEGRFVLAFDSEDRLAAFSGGPAGYASLPGRALAAMLARDGLGLGLNLGEVSSRLLPPDALDWLVQALADDPQPAPAVAVAHHPLPGAPAVADGLAPHLPRLTGMARALYLTLAEAADGTRRPRLSVETETPKAADPLARMLAEALRFAGIGEIEGLGEIEIAIHPADDPALAGLADVAHRLTPPAPVAAAATAPKAPGRDPDKPPILKF
ncbi:SseB family protein [Paracoccus sp. p3-h83]|uniref:SseB family protein n=1 Tax=Paracoccus sp. p3-h83 TaxID=3342805 RepID=UPI0035B8E952